MISTCLAALPLACGREANVEFSYQVSGEFTENLPDGQYALRPQHYPTVSYLMVDLAEEKTTPSQAAIVDNVANLVVEGLFVSRIRGIHLDNLQAKLVTGQVRCCCLANSRGTRDEHSPLSRRCIWRPTAAQGAHEHQH